MESQIWSLRASSVSLFGEGSERNSGFCQHFCLGESCPPPQFLPWCQAVRFLLICLRCLSLCCPHTGAQREWVWVSLRTGPWRGSARGSSSFCLPQPQCPLVFVARSYGDFSSWPWSPGQGGFDPWLLRYPSWFLSTTRGCRTSLFHISTPPAQSQCGFFCNSVVVGLPFSLISDGSEWWWFYHLVVILMRLCEEVRLVYLHCHLNQKSSVHFWLKFLNLQWVCWNITPL